MGPWYLSAALQQDVADILKVDISALEAYWARMCAKAQDTAYADILGILLAKGYTVETLDMWDNRATYSRQQALFWLYTETSLGMGYDDKEISKLDRRKDLTTAATIMVNGVATKPDTTASGNGMGVSGGMISECGFRIDSDTEF